MSGEFGDLDLREIEPGVAGGSSKAIPAGKYKAMIVKSEWSKYGPGSKDTSDGKKLSLTLEVLDGEHKGHRVYANLNLFHSNQTAVEIARSELKAICVAIGMTGNPKEAAQLHDIPMVVGLGINKYVKDGDEKINNKVLAYTSTEVAAAKKAKKRETVPADAAGDDDSPF